MKAEPVFDEGTALLVIDVQNDFADPAGSLSVKGGAGIISAVNGLVSAAREAGALVVYSADWHPPITPHFLDNGGLWPVHCVSGTWGAMFHPALALGPDVIIHKGTNGEDGYSAFSMRDPQGGRAAPTGLDVILRTAAIKKVVVCGLATDYCVKASVLDAIALGFGATVVTAAIAAVNLDDELAGFEALVEMRNAGAALL